MTALKQLDLISYYMKDFRAILDVMKGAKPGGARGGFNATAIVDEDSEEDE